MCVYGQGDVAGCIEHAIHQMWLVASRDGEAPSRHSNRSPLRTGSQRGTRKAVETPQMSGTQSPLPQRTKCPRCS
eukprot:scaffold233611_cov34-Prasinocladus_malaysianus.AAC.1